MKQLRLIRSWLIAIPFTMLVLLMAAPASRTVVWTQLRLLLPTDRNVAPFYCTYMDGAGPTTALEMRREARRHPDVYEVQLAKALFVAGSNGSPERQLSQLRSLQLKFPNNPSLLSNTLRVGCRFVMYQPATSNQKAAAKPASYLTSNLAPKELALFIREAQSGEKADPNNAYFPLLESMFLRLMHRDAEAIATVEGMRSCQAFDDYSEDETRGEYTLYSDAFGGLLAIPANAIQQDILYPHYAVVRDIARFAMAEAIKRELSGDKPGGMRIRQALTHTGELMRIQSKEIIGNLVGIAVTDISWSRPGGAPNPANMDKMSSQARLQYHLDAYKSYLISSGLQREIPAIVEDAAAETQVKVIASEISNSNSFPYNPQSNGDTFAWIIDMVILDSAAWILVLGGLGSLIQRLRKQWMRKPFLDGALEILYVLTLLAAVPLLYRWQAHRCFSAVAQLVKAYLDDDTRLDGISKAGAAAAAILPLLFVGTLTVVSGVKKFPLSKGLSSCGAPITAILLVLYIGTALVTTRYEVLILRRIQASQPHEGRYYAIKMHMQWPGMIG